jgi:hypothetical protein
VAIADALRRLAALGGERSRPLNDACFLPTFGNRFRHQNTSRNSTG